MWREIRIVIELLLNLPRELVSVVDILYVRVLPEYPTREKLNTASNSEDNEDSHARRNHIAMGGILQVTGVRSRFFGIVSHGERHS